ncbi:MAG: hypothetical protein ACSW8G_00330, partial [Bacillota bacterium]
RIAGAEALCRWEHSKLGWLQPSEFIPILEEINGTQSSFNIQIPEADLFGDPGTVAVARMTGCKNFSRAKRLDEHRLRLTEWGIDIELEREIPEGTNAIGYRAHAFEPIWGERQKNCLKFNVSGVDELPFERRYYIFPEDAAGRAKAADLICWFIQDSERAQMDGQPDPDYLKLREESIMLLHE